MGKGVATKLVVVILKSPLRPASVTPVLFAVGFGAVPVAAACVPTVVTVVAPFDTAKRMSDKVPASKPVMVTPML